MRYYIFRPTGEIYIKTSFCQVLAQFYRDIQPVYSVWESHDTMAQFLAWCRFYLTPIYRGSRTPPVVL